MGRIHIEIPSSFLYETILDVRASDLNYGNHLGHDSVLTIMQEARIKFYRTLGFTNELSFEGDVGQVISDVATVYKSEAFLGDVLLCKIAAADFNKYGFDWFISLSIMKLKRKLLVAKRELFALIIVQERLLRSRLFY
jgi:acyl-CoA thioester hydrolase